MTLKSAIILSSLLVLPVSLEGDAVEVYLQQIKPVLKARCFACHGALKQKAKLRLDTAEAIQTGGNTGPVINLISPGKSLILERLSHELPSERMPPEGKPLHPEMLRAIEQWIQAGAPKPSGETPEEDPRNHWAFVPPRKPLIPTKGKHPIDALLERQHGLLGIQPQGQADPKLLMRRLFLDLVGLPPLPEQTRMFAEQASPQNYDQIVQRLLASPQYGERWGRHWMDVWRYTDWFGLGNQLRYSQKHIWHWRDWILDSLNQDKGYDQMILEMLAADESYPLDQARLRATGFLARNYFLFNRTTWLDKTIEHTSKAFLGLTMQCSKCHDHKYDPISMKDYYQFRAIFEPHQIRTDMLPGENNLEHDGLPRAFDMHPEAATYIHSRGNEKTPDRSHPVPPAPPSFLKNLTFQVKSVRLPLAAYRPELSPHVKTTLIQDAQGKIRLLSKRLEILGDDPRHDPLELREMRLQLRAARLQLPYIKASLTASRHLAMEHPSELTEALILQAAESAFAYEKATLEWKSLQAEHALSKASQDKKGMLEQDFKRIKKSISDLEKAFESSPKKFTPVRASIKALESPAELPHDRHQPYPSHSSGRRLALARWITQTQNPLTARVAINHIWKRHFGTPLVAPLTDFGRRTPAPALQEVMDYLAVFLMENHWRMKPIHRLIVTSKAYQRTSTSKNAMASNLRHDPENKLLWRQNPVRMESQLIRDSLLHLSKQINTRMGGASISTSLPDLNHRRSIYFKHSRDDLHPFLKLFDDASIIACYQRQESIIPQQALAMANSQLAMDTAAQIVHVIESAFPSPNQTNTLFIQEAFEHVLCWKPSQAEMETSLQFLHERTHDKPPGQAPGNGLSPRACLVHALLNHNDFITIR
jgi:hypothetical protein